MILSESVKAGTAPWPKRSSGTKAAPLLRRGLTPMWPQGSASMDDHAGALKLALAGDRIEKLRLAVAGDAGDGDDLAGPYIKRDVLQFDGERPVGGETQMVEAQPHLACRLLAAVADHMDVAADHELGEAAAVSLVGSTLATTLPWRRMVALWQSRFTSSRRWLI